MMERVGHWLLVPGRLLGGQQAELSQARFKGPEGPGSGALGDCVWRLEGLNQGVGNMDSF